MKRTRRLLGLLTLSLLPAIGFASSADQPAAGNSPAVVAVAPTSGPMSMGGDGAACGPKPFVGNPVSVEKRRSSVSGVVTPRLPPNHTGFMGVINFFLVNTRTGPGTSWRIVTTLRKDTPVRVLGQRAGWLYIQLQDGRRAWVSGNLVSMPGSSKPLLPGVATTVSGGVSPTPASTGNQGATMTSVATGVSAGTATRATAGTGTGSAVGTATTTRSATGTNTGTAATTATNSGAGTGTGVTTGVPVTGDLAGIPARPADAIGGREFMNRTRNLDRTKREEAILAEILRGNIPDFLRQLKTVIVPFKGRDGREHTISYQVMPDYLAIGSNSDYIRIPMNPMTAQKIADRFGCSLPTRKMVNDIYGVAEVKLAPKPLPAGPRMMSNEYYERHQELVSQQLGNRPPGELIAGNKKDLVISNVLAGKPDRVAIYGWHQTNGKPIQGLSTVHENTYADYSHGARMIGKTVVVDGQEMAIDQVLRDPDLSRGLSDEGPITVTRQPRT